MTPPFLRLPLFFKLSHYRKFLLQLCELRLGLFQNGDVRVGVFPEVEKFLISGLPPGGIAIHFVSPASLKICEGSNGITQNQSAMGEYFLKLAGCVSAFVQSE